MACPRVNFTFYLTFTTGCNTSGSFALLRTPTVPTIREYFHCIRNTITTPSFVFRVGCYVQIIITRTSRGPFVLPYALNLSSKGIYRVSCACVVKGETSRFPYLYRRKPDIKLFLRPWFPHHRKHNVSIVKNNHINVGRFLCKLYGISVTCDRNQTAPTKKK